MPRRTTAPALEPKTFEELVRGVQQTFLAGKRRIEWTAVFTDWDTGRLINVHILLNRDRASYAEGVIVRLAKRTGINERALYYCARFHRLFPILNRGSKLTTRHYRYLCQIENEQKREALQAAAETKDWTSDELEDRVRQFNLGAGIDGGDGTNGSQVTAGPKPKLLTPKRGTPGLFLVVTRGGTVALDLGYKMYRPLDADPVRRMKLTAGSIVRGYEPE